jgi:hypothetical protein
MAKLKTLLLSLTLLSVTACAPIGVLYTSVKNPSQFDPGRTTNMGATTISGEACATQILGLIAIGDWSVQAALDKAGASGKTLKNIAIDTRVANFLGVYTQFCTRVTAQVSQ